MSQFPVGVVAGVFRGAGVIVGGGAVVAVGSTVFGINAGVAAMGLGTGASVGSGAGVAPLQASRAARANRIRDRVVMGRSGFGIGRCPYLPGVRSTEADVRGF